MVNLEYSTSTPSADRPILSASGDRLGRKRFAEAVAKAIHSWSGEHSFVVSLDGPWGCGKTSLKNLVLEALHTLDSGGRKVMDFSPWQVSGEQNLVSSFFDALGVALQDVSNAKRSVRILRLMRKYKKVVEGGTQVVGVIAKLAQLPIVGTLLLPLLKMFGAWVTASPDALKKELTCLLSSLEKPFLVVIDDVDRLTDDEIGLLFRLIKCNADFPNLIYLLLFDRDYVEGSLDRMLPPTSESGSGRHRGSEYLKKIVQVSYRVPAPNREQLEAVLFDGLDRVLEASNALPKFDKDRWNFLFPDGIRPYFRTLRDVKRFLSSLEFHCGLFKGESVFEADPIDLIALEVLRLFEPSVYAALSISKPRLLKVTNYLKSDEDKREDGEVVKEIIASSELKEATSVLVRCLFPYAGEVVNETFPDSGSDEDWFVKSRICDGDRFDSYFVLDFSTGHLSNSEIDSFLKTLGKDSETGAALDRYAESGRLPLLLDALDNYKGKINPEHAPALVLGLLNIGDRLPYRGMGIFGDDPRMACTRIVLFALKGVHKEEERFQIIKDAIGRCESFVVPAFLVHILERLSTQGWGDLGQLFSKTSYIEDLAQLTAAQIEKAAERDELRCCPRTPTVVDFWHQRKPSESSKTWLKKKLKEPKVALTFLTGFMSSATQSSTSRVGWRCSLNELAEYVPLEEVDEVVKQMEPQTDVERLVRDCYLHGRARQRAGESNRRFRDEDSYIWSDIRNLY